MLPTFCAPGEGAVGGPGGSGSRRAADGRTRESKRRGKITVGVVLGRTVVVGVVFLFVFFSCLILKRRRLFLNSSVTREGPEEKASQTLPKRRQGPARRGARRRPVQRPQAEPAAGREREPRQGREAAGKAWVGRPGGKGRAGLPGGAGWSAAPGRAGLLPAPSLRLRDAPRSLTQALRQRVT